MPPRQCEAEAFEIGKAASGLFRVEHSHWGSFRGKWCARASTGKRRHKEAGNDGESSDQQEQLQKREAVDVA